MTESLALVKRLASELLFVQKSPRKVAQKISLLCAVGCNAGCVYAPSLENPLQDPASVSTYEIVKRIKCEIYTATKELRNEPKIYPWFQKWTAKGDINFLVNENGSVGVGVQLTRFFKNAFPPEVGPMSKPLTSGGTQAIGGVAQRATLGVGAGVGTQAVLTDDVVFTMSVGGEVQPDVKNNPAAYGLKEGGIECDHEHGFDLNSSSLGLKPWIDNLLGPVTPHPDDSGFTELKEGYHEQKSLAGQSGSKQLSVSPPKTSLNLAFITSLNAEILGTEPESFRGPIQQDLINIGTLNTDVAKYRDAALKHNAICADILKAQSVEADNLLKDQQGVLAKAKDTDDIKTLRQLGNSSRENLRHANDNATNAFNIAKSCTYKTTVPKPKDPPYDSFSTQIQFVVVSNLSATPNWGLASVSGPFPTNQGSLLGLSRSDTHTLTITLAPDAMVAGQQNQNVQFLTALHTITP
jgi:hypothetical protein